ncbi:hypothetical protein ACFVQ0_28180 [Streptomyces sp. NPDC057900]|uniref:hypothetical protein n=1 Tax=Streptomyces sp. NPDC057900 TaxID=3346274 RepID=UPI0036E57F2B
MADTTAEVLSADRFKSRDVKTAEQIEGACNDGSPPGSASSDLTGHNSRETS